PRRRDTGAGEAEPPLVQHEARLPARVELRVEAIEALDLEPGVGPAQDAPDGALEDVLRLGQQAREGGEVERDLVDTALPERLQRPRDQVLGHAVRRGWVTTHERERERRTP